MSTVQIELIPNYVGGSWHTPSDRDALDVINPATGEPLARVPLSTAADVDRVVKAAVTAFETWRRTPPTERIQYLFAFKQRLEEQFEDLAFFRQIGKIFDPFVRDGKSRNRVVEFDEFDERTIRAEQFLERS